MIHPSINPATYFSDAYQWLCKCRKNHPPDSDIWDLKRQWADKTKGIISLFTAGSYRFDTQKRVRWITVNPKA